MIVRTLVIFHTDIPDDAIMTADGMNFVQWPGRNVVEAIADLLRTLGWTPDDPFDLEERGWDLDASSGNNSISLRIEVPEEVLVQITDRTPEFTWYLKRKPPGPVFTRLLTELDKALKADSRFRDILWFKPQGYLSQPGAALPVEVGEDI
jgi:hypothetical protein